MCLAWCSARFGCLYLITYQRRTLTARQNQQLCFWSLPRSQVTSSQLSMKDEQTETAAILHGVVLSRASALCVCVRLMLGYLSVVMTCSEAHGVTCSLLSSTDATLCSALCCPRKSWSLQKQLLPSSTTPSSMSQTWPFPCL